MHALIFFLISTFIEIRFKVFNHWNSCPLDGCCSCRRCCRTETASGIKNARISAQGTSWIDSASNCAERTAPRRNTGLGPGENCHEGDNQEQKFQLSFTSVIIFITF